jgi:chromosome segregation ATPase
MTESRVSLEQSIQQAEKCLAQVPDLETKISLAQKDLKDLENKSNVLAEQSRKLEREIASLTTLSSGAIADIDQHSQDRDRISQDISNLKIQFHQENNLLLANQKISLENQEEILRIREAFVRTDLFQQIQDGQSQLIGNLESRVSAHGNQVKLIESRLSSFIRVEDGLKEMRSLAATVDDLKLQILSMEKAIQKRVDERHKKLTKQCLFFGGMTAIAAAGLAILGQWYMNQTRNQPLPTPTALSSLSEGNQSHSTTDDDNALQAPPGDLFL